VVALIIMILVLAALIYAFELPKIKNCCNAQECAKQHREEDLLEGFQW